VGELTVLVESGPQASLAAVVRGQPPDSCSPAPGTPRIIHFQFAAAFAAFEGDAAPFAEARLSLEGYLETVLQHRPGGEKVGQRAWLRWAVPLMSSASCSAGGVEIPARFRVAVNRLEAEPGIEVTSAERGLGGWRCGLSDPLATQPA
jgi:hypothetical protein